MVASLKVRLANRPTILLAQHFYMSEPDGISKENPHLKGGYYVLKIRNGSQPAESLEGEEAE